jgi:thioredoxin 1
MKSMNVVEVTDANFEETALRFELPVLLDFGADWCPPCRAMEPHVGAVAEAYAGRLRVGAVDTDRNQAVAARYGVHGLPTFVVLKDGKVVDKVVGAMPRSRLEALVQRALR